MVDTLASKFVDGVPLGPWNFQGTRSDDPNDRVDHEHRREIRGMRIISSWLNDTDRRDANTMSVYTDQGYIRHLVQDFGNTLGANGASIHYPIYGQAYLVDPRYMMISGLSLGLKVHPWEEINAENYIPHPSVGYYRSETFRPGNWVSVHPIPAFENMTLRDAFWGAKQVMSFSDEDIRAIVETGELSNKEAEEYLIKTLIVRRDMIGDYWFSRINPIDRFIPELRGNRLTLRFTDLGTEKGIFENAYTRYGYTLKTIGGRIITEEKVSDHPEFRDMFTGDSKPESQVLVYEITTLRENTRTAETKVTVYVVMDEEYGTRIGGIQRQE